MAFIKTVAVKGFFLYIILIFCFLVSCQKKKPGKITLSINGRPLYVEVARTESQRRKGLMNRDSLGWNEGMLFVFEEERLLSFWMKNTKIPLSIAFIDKDGKVTDIFDMEPYSLKSITSAGMCRFAIEVNRGFFKESGLSAGDIIDLQMVQ